MATSLAVKQRRTRKTDEAIDAFVERVNSSAREPLWYDEVPELLRDGESADAEGYWVRWAIRPAPSPSTWIDAFEAKLPGPLPRSYGALGADLDAFLRTI